MKTFLFALMTSVSLAGAAHAVTIPIDPGNVGDIVVFTFNEFDDLNGQPLDGSTLDLDLVFTDNKALAFTAAPREYLATLLLQLDTDNLPAVSFAVDGFLSDSGGNPVRLPDDMGTVDETDNVEYNLIFEIQPSEIPLVFHDVHFMAELPNVPGVSITGGELSIFDAEFESTIAVIPEPSTFISGLFGAVAIAGWLSIRRRAVWH